MSKTISGDAVLPSQPQLGGDIVIVDRGNGALTFVQPSGSAPCFIARQVAIPGGAKTDPHDVVIVSAHKAYVTRYEANSTATSAQQTGNDVIAIDPATGGYLSRIGMTRTRRPARAPRCRRAPTGRSSPTGGGRVAEPDRRVLLHLR